MLQVQSPQTFQENTLNFIVEKTGNEITETF